MEQRGTGVLVYERPNGDKVEFKYEKFINSAGGVQYNTASCAFREVDIKNSKYFQIIADE